MNICARVNQAIINTISVSRGSCDSVAAFTDAWSKRRSVVCEGCSIKCSAVATLSLFLAG